MAYLKCAIHSPTPALVRHQTVRLDDFDKQAAVITQIRGSDYGPPRQDFERAQRIYAAIVGDNDQDVDPAVRHVFYLMAVKLARLRLSPAHLDSWIDIAGYARCGVSVTDDLLPGGSRHNKQGGGSVEQPDARAAIDRAEKLLRRLSETIWAQSTQGEKELIAAADALLEVR